MTFVIFGILALAGYVAIKKQSSATAVTPPTSSTLPAQGTLASRPDMYPTSNAVRIVSELVGAPTVFNPTGGPDKKTPVGGTPSTPVSVPPGAPGGGPIGGAGGGGTGGIGGGGARIALL